MTAQHAEASAGSFGRQSVLVMTVSPGTSRKTPSPETSSTLSFIAVSGDPPVGFVDLLAEWMTDPLTIGT